MKRNAKILAVACAAAFAGPLWAQEPAPAAAAPPLAVRTVLPGGTVILVQRLAGAAQVGLWAVFPGGTRAETEESCGIHQLLARLFGRPVAQRGAGEWPGRQQGFAGRNSFGLWAEFPRDRLREGLALAVQGLWPSFSEREVRKARDELLSDIRQREEDPADAVLDAFLGTLYRSHPYRLPILGRMSAVAELRGARLRDFYARVARPERLVVAVVGDVDPEAVVETLRSRLPAPPKAAKPAPPLSVPLEPWTGAPLTRAIARSLPQTRLLVGFPGLSAQDADRHALQVAAALLEGPGGRLEQRLRSAGVSASALSVVHMEGIEPGFFAAAAAVPPAQAQAAAGALLAALRGLAESPPSSEELARARERVVTAAALARKQPLARAAELASAELYGLAAGASAAESDALSSVTAEDVQRLARRVFVERAPVTAMLGPGVGPAAGAAGENR